MQAQQLADSLVCAFGASSPEEWTDLEGERVGVEITIPRRTFEVLDNFFGESHSPDELVYLIQATAIHLICIGLVNEVNRIVAERSKLCM